MIAIVRQLLDGDPSVLAAPDAERFLAASRPLGASFPSTVDRAVVAGFAADRVAFAFAAGYQAALRRLVPSLPEGAIACLCASEEGGAHPRAIATRLAPTGEGAYRLDGAKRWVTLAHDAQTLLVVASVGADAAGRNRLRVAAVPSRRDGVTIAPQPPTPFAPEIAHGSPRFVGVRVDEAELLPGDGYDTVLKPFRTLEDVHVMAAIVAHLVGVARRSGWPRVWLEDALAQVVLLRALGAEDASSGEVHVALAGALHGVRRLLDDAEAHWALADPEARARWERDRPLLAIAEGARAKRAEAAFRRESAREPRR